jgi:NADPH-dependent glutamate synthase beta subunit-like oxidoreductase
MILLAMGFTGAEPGGLAEPQSLLPFGPGGLIAPGVYACGDARSGPSLVVKAMADGVKTARLALADLAAQNSPALLPKAVRRRQGARRA